MRQRFSRNPYRWVAATVGFIAAVHAGQARADDKDECEGIKPLHGRGQSLEQLTRTYPCFQRAVAAGPANKQAPKAASVRTPTTLASSLAGSQSAAADAKGTSTN